MQGLPGGVDVAVKGRGAVSYCRPRSTGTPSTSSESIPPASVAHNGDDERSAPNTAQPQRYPTPRRALLPPPPPRRHARECEHARSPDIRCPAHARTKTSPRGADELSRLPLSSARQGLEGERPPWQGSESADDDSIRQIPRKLQRELRSTVIPRGQQTPYGHPLGFRHSAAAHVNSRNGVRDDATTRRRRSFR